MTQINSKSLFVELYHSERVHPAVLQEHSFCRSRYLIYFYIFVGEQGDGGVH